MENEKAAIQRRLAQEARFRQEKENILIELGASPSELLTSSAPQRLRQKLDNNLTEHRTSPQFRDPLSSLEDPVSNADLAIHDIHEDIPTPFNHGDEQAQYIRQEQRTNRWKNRKNTIYISVSVVLILILIMIASTTTIMLNKKSNSIVEDERNLQCTIDRQKIVECASGSLEVPVCANKTFHELRKEILKENELSELYPCDAKHFGLLAVAVAKVNSNDQIENIYQYWILAILYFALGGQDWRQDNNWLTGRSFCDEPWFGVLCSEEGTVESIDLVANKLVGRFPSEIALLNSLRTLHLSNSDISGTLPPEIGSMQNLSSLELPNTQISGTIPSEIGLCQSLEHIDIIETKISGSIPSEIGKLSMLQFLGVLSPLEGTLPTEMGNLSSLSRLDLAHLSNLGGSLPSQFVNLTSLSEFSLTHCFYDDIQFPVFVSSLPLFLDRLEIMSNSLKGSIPSKIGLFQRLTQLRLTELPLTGTLPSEIGLMTELQSLQLFSISSLEGKIPSELGQLTHLTSLDIECTSFTMPIPSEVSSLPGLEVIFNSC